MVVVVSCLNKRLMGSINANIDLEVVSELVFLSAHVDIIIALDGHVRWLQR